MTAMYFRGLDCRLILAVLHGMVYFLCMFSDEVKKMLVEVITSWQVIAVTVALVIYISIVNSVARLNRRRTQIPPVPKEKKKALDAIPPPSAPAAGDDELGLEEEEIKEEE